jgi:hypothetical protein
MLAADRLLRLCASGPNGASRRRDQSVEIQGNEMRRGLCLVIVAGMMRILPAAAVAQSTGTERPWIVTVGLWTLGKPSFGGSDDLAALMQPAS